MKVGVIGLGMVGGNLQYALKYYHKEVYGYDINKPCDKWEDILKTDFTFICVPTNSKDKRLDMSIVYDVLRKLKKDNYKGVAIIKSTLGINFIMDRALEEYRTLKIVVFPEWLREQYAIQDTFSPDMTVIGCKDKELVKKICTEVCPWHQWSTIHSVSPEEATLIKLTANALASTKISFANQIHLICEKYGLSSQNIMDVVKTDPRCAPRYLDPGYPFGGHCLVKDTSELTYSIEKNEMLKGVELMNEIIKERKNAGNKKSK